MTADGTLAHRSQYLEVVLGRSPSVGIVRALLEAIGADDGTVIHWWTHESTVLKDIRRQMEKDGEADAAALREFVHALVGTKGVSGRLVDLGMLVSKLVFYPGTGGSSSINRCCRQRCGIPTRCDVGMLNRSKGRRRSRA